MQGSECNRGSRCIAFAVGAVLLAVSWPAQADGKRDLEDGIAFYDALDTVRAQTRLEAAVRAWDLGPSDRARAFVYLGMLAYELGRSGDAKSAWQAALTLDPDRRPPRGTSPKIISAFERVRRTLPDPPPPVPAQDAPPPGRARVGPPGVSPPPPPRVVPPPKVAAPPPPLPPRVAPPPPDATRLVTAPSTEDEDDGVSPWLWVGIGGAAVAVAAAVLVVVLADGGGADSECAQGDGGCVLVRIP